GIARKTQRHELVRRRDAVQHYRTNVLRVTSQINERGARSVRTAHEIDLVIRERGAHVVEIVHRDVGGVERQVGFGFEVRATFADGVDREERTEKTLRVFGIEELAIQGVRLSGAALIHKNEIAMFADGGEFLGNAGSFFRCGLTWTTSEIEQRIWFALLA